MGTMQDYQNDIDCLVRSITIKSAEQSNLINQNIIDTLGVNYVHESDYTTYRYYLNLSGEYHFTNNDIYINIVETGESFKLTKTLLDTYAETKNELLKFSTYYTNLVALYPTEETLIKGIITPLDIEEVKSAQNGTILSYSSMYVESNEVEIMRRLDTYSTNMYMRWFNPFYLETDPLYLGFFLAFLYSTFNIKIETMRFENIHTHKAHSYHIEQFFKSNLNLDTTYLNFKSKMWLYQNLRAVMTNNGKDETLRQVLDNVITENEVGIGKLSVQRAKPDTIARNLYLHNRPLYDNEKDNTLVLEEMNQYFDPGVMSLEEVINTEIDNKYIHNNAYLELKELVDRIRLDLNKNTEIYSKSKILHMIGKEERDILPFPRINVVLDNLFYMYSNTDTDYEINFIDTNTNSLYMITFRQGVKLLTYLLTKFMNLNVTALHFKTKSILLNEDIAPYENLLIDDGSSYEYIEWLNNNKPNIDVNGYNNIADATAYMESVVEYFVNEWILKSSLESQISIANIEVLDRVRNYAEFSIEHLGIANEIGFKESTDGYDYISAIKSLVSVLTDGQLTLDINEINSKAIESYADIVRKTTSYHLQILIDGDFNNKLHIFDPDLGILETKPIISFRAYLNGYENLIGQLIENPISLATSYKATGVMAYLQSELNPNIGTAISPDVTMLHMNPRLFARGFGMVDVQPIADNTAQLQNNLDPNIGSGLIMERTNLMLKPTLALREFSVTNIVPSSDNSYQLGSDLTANGGTGLNTEATLIRKPTLIEVNADINVYSGGSMLTKTIIDEE